MNDVTSVLDTFFTPGAPAPPDAAPPQPPPPAADPDLGRTLDLFNAGPQNRFAAQDERLGGQRRLQERQPAVAGLVGRVARKGVPFLSAGVNVLEADAYAGARQRAETGEASNTDLAVIAKYERDRQGDAERGFGGKLVDTGLGLGAIYGEARVGGALVGRGSTALGLSAAPGGYLGRTALATPLTPSLYAERAANKNLEEGRAATDPRGLPPALGLAFLQNLVIGKVPALGAGVPGGLVGRSLASGLGGTAALGGADVAAGLADEVLPKAYRMDTKYGTIGKLVGIGQPRDVPGALEDVAVSVLAFSVFAGLHNQGAPTPAAEGPGKGLMRVPPEQARTRPSDEVMGAWKDALNHMQENGYTKEKAAQETRDIFTKFDGLFKKNPSAGPAEARDLFKNMPDGPIKDFAHTLADQLPTTTAGQARPPVRELPDARKALPAAKVEAAPENPPQSFHSENFEPPAEPISSKNAPGSLQPETGPTARPAGDRPADATPAPGELRLGPPDARLVGKFGEAPRFSRHPLLDAGGKEVGDVQVHLGPDGVLDIHWIGVKGAQGGGAAGALGNKQMINVARQLAAAYPTATAVTGLRAGGAHKGLMRAVSLDRFREPAAPPSPVEQMKARIAASKGKVLPAEGQSVEIPGAHRVATVEAPAAPTDPQAAFDAGAQKAGLTTRERHVLAERLKPEARSHAEIAKDAPMLKVSGKPYTRQRVEQFEKDARAKLVKAGVDVPGFDPAQSVAKGVHQQDALDRKLDAVKDGHLVGIEELRHNPKEVAERADSQAEAHARAEAYYNELIDQLAKEKADAREAGGELSPERIAHYKRLGDAFADYEAGRGPAPKNPHAEARQPRARAGGNEKPQHAAAPVALLEARLAEAKARAAADLYAVGHADMAALRAHLESLPKAEQKAVAERVIGRALRKGEKPGEQVEAAITGARAMLEKQESHWHRRAEPSKYDVLNWTPPPSDAAVEASRKKAARLEKKRIKEENDAQANPEGLPEHLLPPKGSRGDSWVQVEGAMRHFGARTVAEDIYKRGGIDPDTMAAQGRYKKTRSREAALADENGMGKIFRDGRPDAGQHGNKGTRSIDQFAMEFAGGDHDKLIGMVERHALAPDADSARWDEYQQKLRDFREQKALAARGEPATAEPTDEELARIEREEPGDAGSADFNEAEFDPAFVRHGGGPRGRSGKVVLPSWDELKKSNVGRAVRVAADEWYKLRGGQFPRMDALSKPVADRAAALISAPAFAHAAVKFLKRAVYGDLSKAQAAKFYTTHAEMRLEYMRRSGKPAAGTLIGPDSPLKTPAEYAATLRDPAFRAYLDRWKKYVVPIMNEHYWDAMGLPHGTPIPTTSQIPGIPINFSRVPEGQTSASAVGSGGKTIKPGNVTQKRFGFNKAATGEHQYETDPEKALENVFRKGAEAAGRAALDREIVARGVGQWGQPGAPIPKLPDGTPLKMVRHVDPEPGTQVAPPRAKTLFIHPDALDEYHNAVGVGNNFRIPLVTPALQGFTRAAIASTVEASFHSATLAGKMLHPYMVRSLAREILDVAKSVPNILRLKLPHLSEGQLERLMGMAKEGATKDRGFESGFLVPKALLEKFPWTGKLDPTRWAAAFLDTVDNMVRLSADRAFRLMRYKGLVEDTAQNKRDFLNDLGNYKEKSQAMVVRILRGTGIGPFATAGTSSVVNAIRSLWLSPGVTAASTAAQARLRLHVGLKIAAVAGLAALYNWLVWGKPEGDEHTPFGAVKTGEKDGRTTFVDPLRELRVRRGLNATGISGLIEDEKLGVNQRTKIHDLEANAQHTLLHPAIGPGVQFGKILTTGNNAMGQRVAGFPEGEGSVEWENFKAAVKNTNPSLAALMGADKAGVREKKPLLPLFTRESVETGLPKLGAPYLMSRKQLPPDVLKSIKEKAASPHREEVVRERK